MAGKILITVSNDGEQNIDVENINVSYLPYLLGRMIKKTIEDPLMTGTDDLKKIKELKETAIDILAKEIGVNIGWISIKEETPDLMVGPFLCKEEGRPTIYTNMYWDKGKQMFGTADGTGYAFITHWRKQ